MSGFLVQRAGGCKWDFLGFNKNTALRIGHFWSDMPAPHRMVRCRRIAVGSLAVAVSGGGWSAVVGRFRAVVRYILVSTLKGCLALPGRRRIRGDRVAQLRSQGEGAGEPWPPALA
ncbi:hypothetical protein GCM10011345_37870 [Gemmobacter megaterium]|nr:hypothetical protein GCM10011345_37870 [Gemmobacter megaterium]